MYIISTQTGYSGRSQLPPTRDNTSHDATPTHCGRRSTQPDGPRPITSDYDSQRWRQK